MLQIVSHSVRTAFATSMLALTLFAVAESALGAGAGERQAGATAAEAACGTPEQPCVMEPMQVQVSPRAARLIVVEQAPAAPVQSRT